MWGWRERLTAAALSVCVAYTGGSISYQFERWLSESATYQKDTAQPEYYSRKCREQEAFRLTINNVDDSPTTEHVERPNKPDTAQQADQPNYCDLAAQYIAARGAEASGDWAWWTMLLTAFGVMLLWQTLRATRGTLAEAKGMTVAAMRSADAAVNAVEAAKESTRRTLAPQLRVVKSTLHSNEEIVAAIITFENIGKSPAKYISVEGRLIVNPKGAAHAVLTEGGIVEINTVPDVLPSLQANGLISFSREQLGSDFEIVRNKRREISLSCEVSWSDKSGAKDRMVVLLSTHSDGIADLDEPAEGVNSFPLHVHAYVADEDRN